MFASIIEVRVGAEQQQPLQAAGQDVAGDVDLGDADPDGDVWADVWHYDGLVSPFSRLSAAVGLGAKDIAHDILKGLLTENKE